MKEISTNNIDEDTKKLKWENPELTVSTRNIIPEGRAVTLKDIKDFQKKLKSIKNKEVKELETKPKKRGK